MIDHRRRRCKKRLVIAGLAENQINKRTQRAQFSKNAISNAVVILSLSKKLIHGFRRNLHFLGSLFFADTVCSNAQWQTTIHAILKLPPPLLCLNFANFASHLHQVKKAEASASGRSGDNSGSRVRWVDRR